MLPMNNTVENEILVENTIENTTLETDNNYNEIIGKLDEVIFYQQHSYTVSIFTLIALVVVLIFYLIYKFIINFIEF